jgi:hypothetical protein
MALDSISSLRLVVLKIEVQRRAKLKENGKRKIKNCC